MLTWQIIQESLRDPVSFLYLQKYIDWVVVDTLKLVIMYALPGFLALMALGHAVN